MTTQQTMTRSEKRRALMSKLLAKEGVTLARIPRREGDRAHAPLSFAQEQLWLWYQLEPENPAYAILFCFELQGVVDVAAMERSFTELIRRHEVLRTAFEAVRGELAQVIRPAEPFRLDEVDLRHVPPAQQEAEFRHLALEQAHLPFDLSAPPLLRVRLIRLGETDYRGVLVVHHIAYDGMSVEVLTREIAALYTAYVNGEPSPLPELPIQYGDFAAWQREQLQGESLERLLSYWQEQLAGIPVGLDLPYKQPRPPLQTYRGATEYFDLTSLLAPLEALSRSESVSLFMTLLAAFNVLLYRYTRQDDLTVGTPIANRGRQETAGLIGFLINTLVIRSDLSGNPTFREFLASVAKAAAGAYAHQDLPFEMLVDKVQTKRDLSRSPLFQVMFVLQNASEETVALPDLTLRAMDMDQQVARFDLTMSLFRLKEGLKGQFIYNGDLFDEGTVRRMLAHFRTLLEGILADPDATVATIPLLTGAERAQLLDAHNATQVVYPQDATIAGLIRQQVDRTPQAVALVFDGQPMTYHELDRRAEIIAAHLRVRGAGPGVVVGICVERSLEMVIALYAVLKCGAAYVPIDATYPKERVDFMLSDAQAPLLLTLRRLDAIFSAYRGEVLYLDDLGEMPDHVAAPPVPLPDAMLYLMYTSGSTGQPKGAMITYGAVYNFLMWLQDTYHLTPEDRLLLRAPFSFDVAVWECLWPLLNGARVVIAAPEGHKDSAYLVETIIREGVTTMHIVPSVLQLMVEEPRIAACTSLRRITSGGEVLPRELKEKVLDRLDIALYNMYGMTEATIDVAYWRCRRDSPHRSVPIGYPVANDRLYLLDEAMQPVPEGVPGELYIGGIGLARGYHRLPGLTAEKFVPNPFAQEPGERLYRTGDLARYLPDGSIECMGRIDNQVKLRGVRIEPGEIQSILAKHPQVQRAVATIYAPSPDDKRLVVYVVPASTPPDDGLTRDLRRFLQEKLPPYLVPSHFVILESFPLLPNGKINRRALPAPDDADLERENAFVAPQSRTEQRLAGIWRQFLGVDKVGRDDNFFGLGGHSLKAIQLISRVREDFQVDVPLRVSFEAPTIAELAEQIERALEDAGGAHETIAPAPRDGKLPLSLMQVWLWENDPQNAGDEQEQPRGLFASLRRVFERAPASVPAVLRRVLNGVAAVGFSGLLDREVLAHVIADVAARHEVLRTVYPGRDGEPVPAPTAPPALLLETSPAALPEGNVDAWVHVQVEQEQRRSFDLARGPLWRARLSALGATEHVLLLTFHPLLADEWSVEIFVSEMVALYDALAAGRAANVPPLPIQYVDFAAWQRTSLSAEASQAQLDYWGQTLVNAVPVLRLASGGQRDFSQSDEKAVHAFTLSRELMEGLASVARQEGVTLFMVLLAAFEALLYYSTGQRDLLVVTPVTHRDRYEFSSLIGQFGNRLALRTYLEASLSWPAWVQQVRDATLSAYACQDIPFESLAEHLVAGHILDPAALSQVMFSFERHPLETFRLPDLGVTVLEMSRQSGAFDLWLSVKARDAGDGAGAFSYTAALFDAAVIERLTADWLRLLENVVAGPGRSLSELLDALGDNLE